MNAYRVHAVYTKGKDRTVVARIIDQARSMDHATLDFQKQCSDDHGRLISDGYELTEFESTQILYPSKFDRVKWVNALTKKVSKNGKFL